MTCVSMGNPHRVIFVPAPYMVDLPRLGGRLSAMAAMVWSVLRGFLQKTEHDFVQKRDSEEKMLTFLMKMLQ